MTLPGRIGANDQKSVLLQCMNAANRTVVIIGAGNVGTHLAKLFSRQGAAVTIACRNIASVPDLLKTSCNVVSLEDMPAEADLYLLTLKDTVIPEVAAALPELHGVVAHTSGSIGMEPLSKFHQHGVFYPFQTFRKEIPLSVSTFPILVEASDPATEALLNEMAAFIASGVFVLPASERAIVHTAGVFVSNFTNLMYSAGWQLADQKFDAEKMLLPLILETAIRLKFKSPADVQTGPAIRDDRETILKHLEILQQEPALYDMYKSLTNVLLKKYGHDQLP